MVYHSDLNFGIGVSEVLVFDESDEHMLNDPKAFQKFANKAPCICLTATCAEDSNKGVEKEVLEAMKFKIFENLIEDHSSPCLLYTSPSPRDS